jgi:hypothetical protein
MKMSYCQPQGHTGHFISQTENPFKIIKIAKHLDFSDSRFFRQQLFKKSHFSKKRVPEKRNQTSPNLWNSIFHIPTFCKSCYPKKAQVEMALWSAS